MATIQQHPPAPGPPQIPALQQHQNPKASWKIFLLIIGLILLGSLGTGFVIFQAIDSSVETFDLPKSLIKATTSANISSFPETKHECSHSSFLLNDGVCDRDTNTELCIYDGGDCCLENKVTDLCQDECICKLPFDLDQLTEEMAELGAKFHLDHESKEDRFRSIMLVEDVEFKETCFALCLSEARMPPFSVIDSMIFWIQDGKSFCQCSTMEDCSDETDVSSVDWSDNDIDGSNQLVVVLTSRLLPCVYGDCFYENQTIAAPHISGGESFKQPSAEHCQNSCQEFEGCTHFSWVSEKYPDHKLLWSCWMYSEDSLPEMASDPGIISGPSNCSVFD